MTKWMIRLIDLRDEKLAGARIREIVGAQLSTQGVRVTSNASAVIDGKGQRPDEWCLTVEDRMDRELAIVHLMLSDLLPRLRMRLLDAQPVTPPAQRQAPQGERVYPRLRSVPTGGDTEAPTRRLPAVQPRSHRGNSPYGTISGSAPYAGECR